MKAVKIDSTDAQTIQDVIVQNVEVGSMLHTDEAAVYHAMGGLFLKYIIPFWWGVQFALVGYHMRFNGVRY